MTTFQQAAKQLVALTALAFAGGAAMAGDITVVEDHFVAQKTRAEVQAEVLQARASGTLQRGGEADAGRSVAAESALTREQVRAELRNTPKVRVVVHGDAA